MGFFKNAVIVVGGLFVLGAIFDGTESNAVDKPTVTVSSVNWSRGGFDTVMIATFVINNRNSFAIKDATVKCVHSAPSGSEIDSNSDTIYRGISAGGSIAVHDFNMGFIDKQATRTKCLVTKFKKA